MPDRSNWFSSLRAKIALLIAMMSIVAFSVLFIAFLAVHHELREDFNKEKMALVENFVSGTLKPIMMAGRAPELMPILVENYKHLIETQDITIIRSNGVEAFTDDETIKEVNKFLDYERFKREKLKQPQQIIPADDEMLKKVLATGKKLVFKKKRADGEMVTHMMIPFINEDQCQVCHGSDLKVRGVMLASFSTGEGELHMLSYLYLLGGLAVLAVLLIAGAIFFTMNRYVVNPVSSMVVQVNKIVEDERFDMRINLNVRDEINDLAVVLNYLIASVEDYRIEQELEKDRLENAVFRKTTELREKNKFIEQDLLLAKRIQQRLLPEKFPDIPGISFDAAYLPCLHIGGDYYDVFEMPNQHLGIFIADASGHGSAAALLVSIVKALMTTIGRDIASPSYVIQLINKTLADLTPDDAFVTLFYGVINTATGRMLYSLAGHPPPIIYNRHSGEQASLETNGSLVGVFDFDKFTDSEYYFKAGDRLVAYTDGIIEATDDKKNYFGQNRMVSIVQNNPQLKTESIISALLQELNEFTKGASLADDVTILVVDYDKENENNKPA